MEDDLGLPLEENEVDLASADFAAHAIAGRIRSDIAAGLAARAAAEADRHTDEVAAWSYR